MPELSRSADKRDAVGGASSPSVISTTAALVAASSKPSGVTASASSKPSGVTAVAAAAATATAAAAAVASVALDNSIEELRREAERLKIRLKEVGAGEEMREGQREAGGAKRAGRGKERWVLIYKC